MGKVRLHEHRFSDGHAEIKIGKGSHLHDVASFQNALYHTYHTTGVFLGLIRGVGSGQRVLVDRRGSGSSLSGRKVEERPQAV